MQKYCSILYVRMNLISRRMLISLGKCFRCFHANDASSCTSK